MSHAPANSGRLRVGTDLVHVPAVAESIDRFGHRYLERVYTDAELATCADTGSGWSTERLAARFAAKEAVLKVLRPREGMSYRDIEVVHDRGGAPEVALHGTARHRAAEVGLGDASISLSHDGSYAMAVFAAVVQIPPSNQKEDHP